MGQKVRNVFVVITHQSMSILVPPPPPPPSYIVHTSSTPNLTLWASKSEKVLFVLPPCPPREWIMNQCSHMPIDPRILTSTLWYIAVYSFMEQYVHTSLYALLLSLLSSSHCIPKKQVLSIFLVTRGIFISSSK